MVRLVALSIYFVSALFVGTTKCSLVRSNPEDVISNCTFHQVIERLSHVECAFLWKYFFVFGMKRMPS